MAKNLRGEEVGDDGLTPAEREAERLANLAAADARRAAGSAPGSSFPTWAYIVIGVGSMAVLGVAFYFIQR